MALVLGAVGAVEGHQDKGCRVGCAVAAGRGWAGGAELGAGDQGLAWGCEQGPGHGESGKGQVRALGDPFLVAVECVSEGAGGQGRKEAVNPHGLPHWRCCALGRDGREAPEGHVGPQILRKTCRLALCVLKPPTQIACGCAQEQDGPRVGLGDLEVWHSKAFEGDSGPRMRGGRRSQQPRSRGRVDQCLKRLC